MENIKTINFRFMLWFGTAFFWGAVAVSLMSRSLICDDLQIIWPMYLGIVLFGLFGIVGLIGVIVLLRKYLILKNVLKYGTETVGEFVSVGKPVGWSTDITYRRRTTYFTQIIFTYTVDNEKRTYTSCAVYSDKQAEKLEELKTFPVKYKGKHAIICTIV